ncbi:hypothetical protein PR002_g4729 [Phytophthora rubi]|uniref:Uncharacterized protein n=1 Tax=Phytophthora rubi TaxID=129364 RepID=A0A6A3N9F6_9STRA|nr:hypothetical protein PR002_g4729 [Phytophthora rubi]
MKLHKRRVARVGVNMTQGTQGVSQVFLCDCEDVVEEGQVTWKVCVVPGTEISLRNHKTDKVKMSSTDINRHGLISSANKIYSTAGVGHDIGSADQNLLGHILSG